ncbi:S41 family peptidase [Flagellimonas myxillae]|uniref:S41 family peptidase n=1 Tax=Flagellimonas myxillae TaxID=2942214 RepID=UPI00201ECCA7|nr:S41 family peptidase [Muricauda myxillae]MCL6266335.1 S41 family peptidase [Muricauda myxillae]
MKQYVNIFLYLLLCCLGFNTVDAQELSKADIDKVVLESIKTIDRNYIVPKIKEKVITGLRNSHEAGKYNQFVNRRDLAKSLTNDLRSLSDDFHLYLVAKSKDEQVNARPRRQMMRSAPDPEAFKGLLTYEMLEGNIAYLKVPLFGPLDYVKADIDSFLELSLDADALIVDVRECPGGYGETLAYLAGGFMPKSAHLTTYYSQEGSDELFSFETKHGKINKDKEVYVLVGNRTGSAAEGFAFYLQQLDRISVVGKSSAGGGRSNEFFPIGEHFDLSVSVRNSVTPNGKQFQGVGVQPNLITPEHNALDQAHINALLNLQAKYPERDEKYATLISKIGQPEVALRKGDKSDIEQTVLGYLENFFENNTEEMFKYLHPQLAKRGISKKRGESTLFFEDITREQLTAMLQRKPPFPKDKQQHAIEILDVFHNTATVRVATGYPGRMEWIEYIHLCRLNDTWSIANIIWDYYPKKDKQIKRTK